MKSLSAKYLGLGSPWIGASWNRLAVVTFLVTGLTLIGLLLFRPLQERTISPNEIDHIQGLAYRAYIDMKAPLPYLFGDDSVKYPRQSNIVLIVDAFYWTIGYLSNSLSSATRTAKRN